jgi:hypothetical protein
VLAAEGPGSRQKAGIARDWSFWMQSAALVSERKAAFGAVFLARVKHT